MKIERMYQSDVPMMMDLFRFAGMEVNQVNEKFFLAENNIVLVAKKDTNPVGFLYAYVLESIKESQPQMFLYSIDVFPPYQKQGIGTALIEELKKMAIAKNCSEVFVLTKLDNVAANRLYQITGGMRENQDDVMYVYPL